MTIASTILKGSLRLIGALGEGETPTSQMYSDSLTALNEFIDSLANSPLAIYSTQTQSFTWPANTTSRTLGPSGNFVGVSPVSLDEGTHFEDSSGFSYGVHQIPESEYQLIPDKTITGTYPTRMFVNYTEPNVTIYVYPVPSVALTFKAVSLLELTQPSTINTNLVIPSGYDRFFRYNLAVALAAEFGVEPSPSVQRIAMSTMRAVKRRNKADLTMSLPDALIKDNRSRIIEGL